jgi:hypothetical protein
VIASLGAGVNTTRLAQAACGKDNVADPQCVDTLLLALTPSSYSANNTAETPGRVALISPAQVLAHGKRCACVQ